MKNRTILLIIIMSAFSLFTASAQTTTETPSAKKTIRAEYTTARFAVSTNVVDWAWYITPNIEAQFAVSKNFSLTATAKLNNWTFKDGSYDSRMRQARQQYAVGMRWWPWYVYSGWWFGGKLQYEEYSYAALNNRTVKEEGDAFGLSLNAGYSVQIAPWFNIDFGIGFWGGPKWYVQYADGDASCPKCGRRVDAPAGQPASKGFFIKPNEVIVSAFFIF